jgi:hypothetical protein
LRMTIGSSNNESVIVTGIDIMILVT